MCFQKFPILHPHEILSYLWDEVGIVVPESEIAKYWHTAWQRGEPWATSSPASDKHIPVGLHGDSARLWSQNKFEKITAIHLNIVHFRPCSVRFSRWCLFSCPTHLLFKNRTLNVVWKRLTWSLESAFEGLHPMTGVGGKPLSQHEQSCAGQPLSRSGAKWALTELRGDWEFHVQTWRPRASWQANRVCFRCPALAKSTQPSYLYWNHHGEECGWESEEYGLAGFMAHALKDTNLCPLLTLSMFRHPSILRWCTMHTLNLGLVFSANGGSLILLAEDLGYFGAGDFDDRLDAAYKHFVAYCRSRHISHSQPPFTPKMVKKKTGEVLLTAKAYNGRIIVMSNLAKFFSIMEANPRHMPHGRQLA
ncbi:unnamed protein product, partial [Cladocopium goreaui]